jgi:surfactin synthase thioesterase subunit
MEMVLPILRADFALAETALPARPVDCPLAVWSSPDDPHATREEVERWSELTTGEVRRREFPGNHFFLRTARTQVLRALSEELVRWSPPPR